ncbi:MAG: CinA family protein [Clostridia bacterium]|nr:CinA family protein [Clostridia bacterium]
MPRGHDLADLWREVTLTLIRRGQTISTMESCTGGLIASLITDTEGASEVLKGAFVTYCNAAKVMQGVPAEVIERYGVYSVETAEAMARACKRAYAADIGVGVTGTLGRPDPNNSDSVPGQVWYAVVRDGRTVTEALALPPLDSRAACKRYVAEKIGAALLEA